MATNASSVHPPHKKASRTPHPDDNESPKFAPMPTPGGLNPPSSVLNSENDPEPAPVSSPEHSNAIPPELGFLNKSYTVIEMSIKSQSKINQKVTVLVNHLSKFNFGDLQAKPGLVALHAKDSCTNKLVTVIEIAKREIAAQNGKLYQYSRLGSELTVLKEKAKQRVGKSDVDDRISKGGRVLGGKNCAKDSEKDEDSMDLENDGEDSEPAFESMKTKESPAREKVRAVPTLTIYVSRVPNLELKERFGEQVNI